ncbi:MAG: thermonuclease family protein [Magnetococcales bacterium]|nr:thermonuclease family protein [Magnetococcales bacterium]
MIIILEILIFSPSLKAFSGNGKQTYGDMEGVIYLRNYDGDTIRFDIPGVHPLLGQNIPVRMRGIDAPEIRAKCPMEKMVAIKTKERIQQLLGKAERITLKETGRDKYFRIVARVVADGIDLGDSLIKDGLAVPYDGKRKIKTWCEYTSDEEVP